MSIEEEIILSFIYKRSGKDSLSSTEIYLPLSIELSWFSTNEAKQFLQHCIDHELLKQTPNGLQPTFDITKIKIPIGFTPIKTYSKNPINQKTSPNNIYKNLLQTLSQEKKISQSELEIECDKQATVKNVHPITIAILYAKIHNIIINYNIIDIEQIIIKDNEK
jgi:hypothetical protein